VPQNGPILEAGCGMGQFIYSLRNSGYRCIGIDTARETIRKVKSYYSEFELIAADIRALCFHDNQFAGCWSLGVLEHFFQGYDEVLKEINRVVSHGGFIFISVPIMSPLRRLKVALRFYENIDDPEPFHQGKRFYQFILPNSKIVEDFKGNGLQLLSKKAAGGINGLSMEVEYFRKPLRRLLAFRKTNIILKGLVKVIDTCLSPLCGHTMHFVFKKPQ